MSTSVEKSMIRDFYRPKNVRNVPTNVKRALVNEALARGVTVKDVVGEILAMRYSFEYELSGETRTRATLDGDQLSLLISPEIDDELHREARDRGMTESSVVCLAIAERYGLVYHPTRRRGRRREPA